MPSLPIPVEMLALPPLAVAAGVDLYLTLLVIGAAPTLGLWPLPLPGALGDLDSPSVLIMVGLFYLLEVVAERYPPASVLWNAFHAIIRPVSGGLLALLLLDGQHPAVVAAGALLAGSLASIAHAVRTGNTVLRWLAGATTPSPRLIAVAEDVLVLGLVSLTLDAPGWACALALGALALALVGTGSVAGAFVYGVGLMGGRVFVQLRTRRWHSQGELPDWVAAALEETDELVPGGAIRGTPIAACRLPGVPRFVRGWLVVRGGSPACVFRRRSRTVRIDLGSLEALGVHDGALFRRVDLGGDGGAFLLFGLAGPSAASLRAELGTT